MSNLWPEGGTWQIWEGLSQAGLPQEQQVWGWASPAGSREIQDPSLDSVMKHQLLLQSVSTELTGLQKGLGAQEIKHMRCYSWQWHTLHQKGCQDTLLEDERVSSESVTICLSHSYLLPWRLILPLATAWKAAPAREASWCNPDLCFSSRDRIKIQIHHPDISITRWYQCKIHQWHDTASAPQ